MSVEYYNAKETRQRGRQAALRQQQERRKHPREWLAQDDPEYIQTVQQYIETRDRCRELANHGDMAARKQADYLDGYLSVGY